VKFWSTVCWVLFVCAVVFAVIALVLYTVGDTEAFFVSSTISAFCLLSFVGTALYVGGRLQERADLDLRKQMALGYDPSDDDED